MCSFHLLPMYSSQHFINFVRNSTKNVNFMYINDFWWKLVTWDLWNRPKAWVSGIGRTDLQNSYSFYPRFYLTHLHVCFIQRTELISPSATSATAACASCKAGSTKATTSRSPSRVATTAAAATVFIWIGLHLTGVFSWRRRVDLLCTGTAFGLFWTPAMVGLAILLESNRSMTLACSFWIQPFGFWRQPG